MVYKGLLGSNQKLVQVLSEASARALQSGTAHVDFYGKTGGQTKISRVFSHPDFFPRVALFINSRVHSAAESRVDVSRQSRVVKSQKDRCPLPITHQRLQQKIITYPNYIYAL